jgi:hypothetical protein
VRGPRRFNIFRLARTNQCLARRQELNRIGKELEFLVMGDAVKFAQYVYDAHNEIP